MGDCWYGVGFFGYVVFVVVGYYCDGFYLLVVDGGVCVVLVLVVFVVLFLFV